MSGGSGAGASPPISRLLLVVRTGPGTNDGTDDGAEFCISDGMCFGLNNAEINDREPGQVDHHEIDVGALAAADIQRIELTTDPGDDAWKPTCVALVADGELLYCNDQLTGLVIGSASGEKKSFVDAQIDRKTCQSCYGGPITHGPMVGHTATDRTTIWARAGSATHVAVRYSTAADLSGAVTTPSVVAVEAADFTVKVELSGLLADTEYHYGLEVDGLTITAPPYPKFRTAPLPASKSTFAFGSCARFETAPGNAWEGFSVFDAARAASPDVLLMIGDNHYGNTTDPARLRFFYRMSRDLPSWQKLAERTPTWAVWDDHDFGPNNSIGTLVGKERSLAAFGDYWANPSAGSNGSPGVWTTFVWGDTQVFLLDDRYHRVGSTMLGDEQRAWLLAKLSASTSTFKIIVSGSTWHDGGSTDSWAAFATERDEILDQIMAQKIGGVVLLSGDIHRSAAFRVRAKSTTGYPVYEYIASPWGNGASTCGTTAGQLFCYSESSLFGLVRVDGTATDPALTFELRDGAGGLLESHTTTRAELTPP
jgi:alkaline phosphatase D